MGRPARAFLDSAVEAEEALAGRARFEHRDAESLLQESREAEQEK